MNKTVTIVWGLLLMIFIPAKAFSWGAATHAYFAKELAQQYVEMHEMEMIYGAVLPDFFHLEFGSNYKDYIADQTHHEFMKMVNSAGTLRQRSFAFGFVSHNDTWGADYTAHHNGRTTPGKGYIITKVELLMPVLTDQIVGLLVSSGFLPAAAQPLAELLAPTLGELFLETSVDVLIKRNEDPQIGSALMTAAQFEDFEVDSLLVNAYAEDFAGKFELTAGQSRDILSQQEKEFRQLIADYGEMLAKDESEAIVLLTDRGVTIAKAYLEAKYPISVPMPPETNAVFKSLIVDHVIPAIENDYAAEVNATLAYLVDALRPVGVETETPIAYRLSVAPNPFNPTTSITFQLGTAGHVRIRIFNVTGQTVETVVEGIRDQGRHTVQWNASGFASGLYVVVMNVDGFIKTKKITLLK